MRCNPVELVNCKQYNDKEIILDSIYYLARISEWHELGDTVARRELLHLAPNCIGNSKPKLCFLRMPRKL
jgi:sulfur relay (sulfurtransferase) DsrC/TusE family protein